MRKTGETKRPRRKTILGLYKDTADARRAVYELQEARFPIGDVSVVMRERYLSSFGAGMSGTLLSLAVGNQASTTPMDFGQSRLPGLEPATQEEAPGFGPVVAAGPLAQALTTPATTPRARPPPAPPSRDSEGVLSYQ